MIDTQTDQTRYRARDIVPILDDRERSIRWLTRKVAKVAPISNTMIWYIVTGKQTAGADVARAIADTLDCPLADLFTDAA